MEISFPKQDTWHLQFNHNYQICILVELTATSENVLPPGGPTHLLLSPIRSGRLASWSGSRFCLMTPP